MLFWFTCAWTCWLTLNWESNGLLGCVIWLGMLYDYLHVLYPIIMG